MTILQKFSIFRRSGLIALVYGSSVLLPQSPLQALSRKAPRIGLLPGVTEPLMNIDGQNIRLQLVRRKIKSSSSTELLATSLPELVQEVFAYRQLRVTIDYQVIDDDKYVTTYDAIVTARRDGLTTRLKARGEYGYPDFRV